MTPEEFRALIARINDMLFGPPVRHVTEEEVLQTYTLQLIGPPREADPTQYVALTQTWLRETEENLTDLLPEGYSARIREWDAREEETPEVTDVEAWKKWVSQIDAPEYPEEDEEETPNE